MYLNVTIVNAFQYLDNISWFFKWLKHGLEWVEIKTAFTQIIKKKLIKARNLKATFVLNHSNVFLLLSKKCCAYAGVESSASHKHGGERLIKIIYSHIYSLFRKQIVVVKPAHRFLPKHKIYRIQETGKFICHQTKSIYGSF